MNPKPDLANLLRQLRLTGILHSLEARNHQAIQSKMATRTSWDCSSATKWPAATSAGSTCGTDGPLPVRQDDRAVRLRLQPQNQCRPDPRPHDRPLPPRKVHGPHRGPCGTGKSHLAQAIDTRPSGRNTMSVSSPQPTYSESFTPPGPMEPTPNDSGK